MEEKLRKGTVCFIVDDNRVLLAHIEYPNGEKKWNGIGGYAEEGEDLKDAVVREAQEETYILLKQDKLKKVGEINMSPVFQLNIFLTNSWEGELQIKDPSLKEFKWFPTDNLPYKEMHKDNDIWLPLIFQGKLIRVTGDKIKEVSSFGPGIFLCKSKNNIDVFFDPIYSHVATHFHDTPHLKDLVVEAIGKLNLTGGEIATQIEMGRIVGRCDVVTVNETNEIVYGVRKNRADDGLVPFVKNRVGDQCSTIALHLVGQNNGTYILSSAWIGPMGDDDEPFPLSPNATPRSKEYWDKHAFVYGSQEIVQLTHVQLFSLQRYFDEEGVILHRDTWLIGFVQRKIL